MVLRSLRRRSPARPPRPSRVGGPAPDLVGVDPGGDPLELRTDAGRRLVLAFLTSSCRSCQPFWTAVAGEQDDPEEPSFVVVTPDPSTEDRREVARRGGDGAVTVVMSSASWHAYGVTGSPFFVVVAEGRVAAEGWAASWADLLALIPG